MLLRKDFSFRILQGSKLIEWHLAIFCYVCQTCSPSDCTVSRNNYVKIYLSVPESWEDHTSLPLSAAHDFNLFATVKEKASDIWRSSRNVYIRLIHGSGPIKQQVRYRQFFNKLECHILQQLLLYFGSEITFISAKT